MLLKEKLNLVSGKEIEDILNARNEEEVQFQKLSDYMIKSRSRILKEKDEAAKAFKK